jgi:hypothetical protein
MCKEFGLESLRNKPFRRHSLRRKGNIKVDVKEAWQDDVGWVHVGQDNDLGWLFTSFE